MDTLTDSMLVTRTLGGDRPAFELLVDRYQTLVCALAYSITGDIARSEDVGQESMVQAWKTLDRLQRPEHFKAWLCGITRNVAKNSNRSQRTKPGTTVTAELPAAQPDAAQQAVNQEEEQLVWQTLETLPETYREPLVLFYRQDQSIAEVAESLEVSTDVVKQRLSRGRGMLREEVAATIERTLSRRVPTRAFTAAVLAAIPMVAGGTASASSLAASGAAASGSAAAAVTGSSEVIANAASATGAAAAGKPASAFGLAKTGSLLMPASGVLIGLAGGAFGAWCSWKSARFQSQRDLIQRMVILYVVGFAIFSLPYLAIKLGWSPWQSLGVRTGTLLNLGWMGIFMTANFTWMLTLFRADAKLRKKAKEEEQEPITPIEIQAWVQQYEGRRWTSSTKLWGAPLIDLRFSDPGAQWRGDQRVVARGWIAIGDYAVGRLFAMGNFALAPVAFGNVSCGLLSLGVVNAGIVSIGVVSLGFLSLGVAALGCLSIGVISAGYLACGVVSFGWKAASGVVAFGYQYAVGETAFGPNANSEASQQFVAESDFFRVGNRMLIDSTEWSRGPLFFCLAVFIVAIVLGSKWIYRRKETAQEQPTHTEE